MNTNTDRHSKSYHRRQIDAAYNSARMADQACDALTEAGNRDGSLWQNPYWVDLVAKARSLADEMADDIDHTITAAMVDGFGPEDFE